ncbi:MAG: YkgJ family cysteine cluster protein [Desulfobulbaceae bacterium]|nr:YkgJ family cysteine cluster protein [Desulfobulbaceae bacterium]MCK5543578.1 YkgJ family cysteine cluster protein [Desulfobulbaceae bacterium]
MSEQSEIFVCQGCGHCCHGKATVSLDKADIERMVSFLKLPFEQVKEKYLRISGAIVQMKIVDGHCIFYKDGCTIHPGKPWRCSEWPLHPSILTDEANFSAISESCAGIKKDLGYEEFCRKFSDYLGKS